MQRESQVGSLGRLEQLVGGVQLAGHARHARPAGTGAALRRIEDEGADRVGGMGHTSGSERACHDGGGG